MKDDDNQELIRAIDRLTMAVRDAVTGGIVVIAGVIVLHTVWTTSHPDNGLAIVSTLGIIISAASIIWVGFNIMRR